MKRLLRAGTLAGLLLSGPAFATELTVWDWKSGDPATEPYFDKVKSDFEGKHPGVTVNFVMQPNDQYYTLLGTALSSEGGPDLVLLNGGGQARARTGFLVRLDDKIADIKGALKGWDNFTGRDGGTYAVPLTIQGFVVYYNKKLYRSAGLDPDKPPRTWTDLTAVCTAFAKTSIPCLSMGNKEGFGMEFWFSSYAASAWTAQQQADFAAGRLAWTNPAVKSILQAWVDAGKAGWFPKGANSTTKFMDEYEGFMRGEDANTIGLISDVAHWKQFDEFLGADDGVFIFPAPGSAQPKMPVAGGIGYGVNKRSPNVDLAIALAKAMAAPEALQLFFANAGAITSDAALDTSSVTSADAKQIFAWLAKDAAPTAHTNASAQELEELHRQSQLLLNGDTTVDAAAARLQAVALDARR